MTIIELLKFNLELLKKLKGAGIRLEDADFVDMYSEYSCMMERGEKVSYAVAILSEKYSVSERKVYALLKHFKSDCKDGAV